MVMRRTVESCSSASSLPGVLLLMKCPWDEVGMAKWFLELIYTVSEAGPAYPGLASEQWGDIPGCLVDEGSQVVNRSTAKTHYTLGGKSGFSQTKLHAAGCLQGKLQNTRGTTCSDGVKIPGSSGTVSAVRGSVCRCSDKLAGGLSVV